MAALARMVGQAFARMTALPFELSANIALHAMAQSLPSFSQASSLPDRY